MSLNKKYNKKINPMLNHNSPSIRRHKGTPDEIKFWCSRHGLKYKEYKCENCYVGIYKMDVIYAKNNMYFGLKSSPCDKCNHHTKRQIFISRNKKLNNIILQLMKHATAY